MDWFRPKRPSLEVLRAILHETETLHDDPAGDFNKYLARREELQKALVEGREHCVPLLLDVLRRDKIEPDFNSQVEYVLRDIGKPAMRGLLEFIRKESGTRLARGLHALWLFGEALVPSIPDLAAHLQSPLGEVRAAAMFALARSGPACVSVFPALLAGTRDSEPGVRNSAAFALKQAGRKDPEVRAALESLLNDHGDLVRRYALNAFRELFPDELPSREIFISLMQDKDTQVVQSTMEWIGELKPVPAGLVDALSELCRRDQLGIAGIESLWNQTKNVSLVLPTVLRSLSATGGGEVQSACHLLTKFGPEAREAVPHLVRLVEGTDYDTLWAACDALAAIGRDAEPAVPVLVKLLEHPSGRVGSSAAHALGAIGRPAFSPVLAALGSGNQRLQEYAADSMGWMGEAAREALPALKKLFETSEGNAELRIWILLAISEIEPSDLGAEKIAVLLGDGLPSNMRARAAEAIGRLGREGRAARGALKKLVNDSDEEIAAAARKALERVG